MAYWYLLYPERRKVTDEWILQQASDAYADGLISEYEDDPTLMAAALEDIGWITTTRNTERWHQSFSETGLRARP